jgi:hypothetical protein
MAAVIDRDAGHDDERHRSPLYLAGLRAREEMRTINGLVNAMRLASFRTYMVSAVPSMSSLVPGILAMAGADVPSALQRLRPSRNWPSCAGFDDKASAPKRPRRRLMKRPAGGFGRPRTDSHWLPLRVADAIIGDGALSDWTEIAVSASSVEARMISGSFELSTAADTARITFPTQLPDILLSAGPGRPIHQLIAHPLLDNRNYVVTEINQEGEYLVIDFKIGGVKVEMPWRE